MALLPFSRIASLRALVVDDMPNMRQNIRLHLGQLGMTRVDQAATPDEAIEYVQKNSYDVVVCDYNLNKETNGQHLLEFFRSRKMLPESTIFIMVTAEASYSAVASAAEFKPDAYMVKPLTATKLAERIERMLEKQNSFLPITQRIERKDLAGAISACDEVQQLEPKWSVEIFKLKARLLLELLRIDEARIVYENVLLLRDDLVWARLGLAKCDVMVGQSEPARVIVESVLKQNQQFIEAYDLLAHIATTQGLDGDALEALKRSARIIPSAQRSRLVGDAAYRIGDLQQAQAAFEQSIKLSKGSKTAQASDVLSLAQVYVDGGNPAQALQAFDGIPSRYTESSAFIAQQAALQAQAYMKQNDLVAAESAYALANTYASTLHGATALLTLAKAAFAVGRDDEGAALVVKVVKSDHENRLLIACAKKVLIDSGKQALVADLIDRAVGQCLAIVTEANTLMRNARFEESVLKLEEALSAMPENTGVLLAAAQIYLLWMSQKGVDADYLARVSACLVQLDALIPGNDRVAKMHLFLRRTLQQNTAKV